MRSKRRVGAEIPCKRQWGSFHSGGMNFMFCDGTVHFIQTDIDLDLLAGMATIAGEETLTARSN